MMAKSDLLSCLDYKQVSLPASTNGLDRHVSNFFINLSLCLPYHSLSLGTLKKPVMVNPCTAVHCHMPDLQGNVYFIKLHFRIL